MKKILALALALGATALLACPMQGGMNNGQMGGACMMQKCQCDTAKLPKAFEALGLSDAQKADVQKVREEGKEFHNKQHEKMMAILTPDQLKKFEANASKMCPKKGGMKMPVNSKMDMKMPAETACPHCDKK